MQTEYLIDQPDMLVGVADFGGYSCNYCSFAGKIAIEPFPALKYSMPKF